MNLEKVKTRQISPDPQNPNLMTKDEMEHLRNSLKQLGYLQPIIIDENNVIIDGEHRWQALKDQGIEEIEVIRLPNLSSAKKRLIRQAMNKIHGTHDRDKDLEDFQAIIEANLEEELKAIIGEEELVPEEEREATLENKYEILITCLNEEHQQQIFDKLKSEGYNCKILISST